MAQGPSFFFLVQEIYWESGERESQRVKGSLGGGQTDRQTGKQEEQDRGL